ncbi:MAG: chloramphenicol O-acetyltransferase type A [Salibacteraceae bacterium]|jgi:chloramphenicol O-acetyltransferase type A
MNKYTVENPNKWARKSTFEFFKTFDIPFFNVTANVDVQILKEYCDTHSLSFLNACLFLSQKTISQIPNFRYRFVDNEIRLYEKTQAGCTILLDDQSFAFCYFPMDDELQGYVQNADKNIQALKSNPDFAPRDGDANMIFYSVLPWVSFTSFQHARRFEKEDSIPRIVFGKYFKQNQQLCMPVSVEVHHSFVDGLHIGQYFEIFQKEINQLKI